MADSPIQIEPPEEEISWWNALCRVCGVAWQTCLDWYPVRASLRELRKERNELKRAKVSLIIIVLVSIGVGFWIRGQIWPPTAAAVSSPATVQIPFAIPDEHEWPPLTVEQIAAWTKTLQPVKISGMKVMWGSEVQAVRFFRSLREVGKRLQFEVVTWGGSVETPEIVVNTLKGNQAGEVVAQLFRDYAKEVNYPVTWQQEGEGESKEVFVYLPDSPPWPKRVVPWTRDPQTNRQTVKMLAALVKKGWKLNQEDKDSDPPFPARRPDIEAWRKEVMDVLNRPELGDGYVARFDSATSKDETRNFLWIEERIRVLNDFIKELSNQ